MKSLLVLVLLLVSCSETNVAGKDTGEDPSTRPDTRVADLVSKDVGRDKAADLDTSNELDFDSSIDATLDTSKRLSNAIAITEVSALIDTVGVAIPIERSDNALPFLSASYHLGDPTLPYLNVDAIIENSELLLARSTDLLIPADESISISGQVVAFDPARIRVQCNPFQTSNVSRNIAFDPVRQDRSFVNLWYRVETGSNNKDVAFLSARFESNTNIIVERVSPAGRVTGHVCITESLGDAFAVQHVLSKIAPAETEVLVPIEMIDLTRSIVFVSHQTTRAESKPGYSQVSCELQSAAVRCLRGLNENEISDLRIQVVTFKDRTTVSRFHVVIEDGVMEAQINMPGIILGNTVVLGPTGVLGEVATNGAQKPDVPGSYVESIVENGGVRFKRGEPGTGRLEFFPQVIIW